MHGIVQRLSGFTRLLSRSVTFPLLPARISGYHGRCERGILWHLIGDTCSKKAKYIQFNGCTLSCVAGIALALVDRFLQP